MTTFFPSLSSAFMNSRKGLGLRNVILGLVLGPLPKDMRAPANLPDNL